MQIPKLPHFIVVLFALAKRFNKFTSWWKYLALATVPLLFVAFFYFLPFRHEFFYTIGSFESLTNACTFMLLESQSQHRDGFLKAYKDFFGVKNLTIVDKEEYGQVMKELNDDELFAVDGCRIANFVYARLFLSPGTFDLSLHHHLFADKLDLAILESKFYPDPDRVPSVHREKFIHYLLSMINAYYGVKANLSSVKVSSMDLAIKEYYMDVNDMSIRLLFLIAVPYLSVIAMPSTFDLDLRYGFIDTLMSTFNFRFSYYLYARFVWSLLYGLLLFWSTAVIALFSIWVNFSLLEDFLMFAVFLFTSYDLHVSYALHQLMLGRKGALVAFCLHFIIYLLSMTVVDPTISPLYDESPGVMVALRLLASLLVPGITLHWMVQTMLFNGHTYTSKQSFFPYLQYLPANHFYIPILLGLVAFYLMTVCLKTTICSVLYRAFWDNVSERKLTCVWFQQTLKPEPEREIFQTFVHQGASSTERLLALKFVGVKMRTRDKKIKITQMAVLYEKITVFYAFSDLQSSTAICRLAAGLTTPKRGQVKLYPSKSMKAKVTFVVTKNFKLTTLTVTEYLKLFCVFEQVPSPNIFTRMSAIINFMGMSALVNTPTQLLTDFEQLKLSTAIALLSQCSVLVFDNPTGGVALEDKREFWEILLKLKAKGRALFLATSSVEEVDYVADFVYIFFNGSIQASGKPIELKRAYMQDDFCLRISKTSLMSEKDIESFIQRVATEKDKQDDSSEQSSQQSTKNIRSKQKGPPVCVFKKDSLNEYIFTFKCDTAKQKRTMLRVLDALYEKGGKGEKQGAQIAINSISRNTLQDLLEELYQGDSRKKPDRTPQQTDVQSEKSLKLTEADTNLKRSRPSKWNTFYALLWGRMCTILRCPPWLIICIILWGFFLISAFYFVAEYILIHNTMTMGKHELAVNWKEVKDKVNASLLSIDSQPSPSSSLTNSTINYHAWVISSARSFSDFAHNYRSAYQLTLAPNSFYHLELFYNQYSPHPELFDLMSPFAKIVHNELSPRHVNFTLDLSYVGHFREGSDIFDIMQAVWFIVISATIVTMIALYMFNQDIWQTRRSGMLHFLRANGVSQAIYVLNQLVTYYFCACIGFYPVVAILLFIYSSPILHRALDVVLILGCTADLTLLGGYSLCMDTYFPGNHLVALGLVFACLFVYDLSIIFAASSVAMSKEAYYWAALPGTLLPTGVSVGQWIKLLLIPFPAVVEQMDRYATNLKAHYEYFISKPAYINLALSHANCFLWYLLCLLYGRFTLYRYRHKEQKQVTFQASSIKDASIHEENFAVTFALQINLENYANRVPEELFVVQNLCHHSGVKPLEGITFLVKRDQCFGIYGLRGAGKSRLLEVLAGMQPFEEGGFYLWNKESGFGDTKADKSLQVAKFKRMGPGSIALCPAFNCVDPRLTTTEALLLLAKLRAVPKDRIWPEVRRIAKIFQLESLLLKTGNQLSFYEARLLTLAMTFIGNPTIILLDHPSSQVESYQTRSIWNILLEAKRVYRSTIILASNSSTEVEALCNRLAVMIQGSFQFIGNDHKLRATHCKGYDIALKVTPARLKESHYMLELRKQMASTFSGVKSVSTHKYILKYHWPEPNISWSVVFERLESLRAKFAMETYTLNVASLDEMFYHFAKMGKKTVTRTETSTTKGTSSGKTKSSLKTGTNPSSSITV